MPFETIAEKAHDIRAGLGEKTDRLPSTAPRLHAVGQLGTQFAIATKETVAPDIGLKDVAMHALVASNPILAMMAPGLLDRGPELKQALHQLARGRGGEELDEETPVHIKTIDEITQEAEETLQKIDRTVEESLGYQSQQTKTLEELQEDTEETQEAQEEIKETQEKLPDDIQATKKSLDELEKAVEAQTISQEQQNEQLHAIMAKNVEKVDEVSAALSESKEITLDDETIDKITAETKELKEETTKQTKQLEDLAKEQKQQKEEIKKHTKGFVGHGLFGGLLGRLLKNPLLVGSLLSGGLALAYKKGFFNKFSIQDRVSEIIPEKVKEKYKEHQVSEKIQTIKDTVKEHTQPVTNTVNENIQQIKRNEYYRILKEEYDKSVAPHIKTIKEHSVEPTVRFIQDKSQKLTTAIQDSLRSITDRISKTTENLEKSSGILSTILDQFKKLPNRIVDAISSGFSKIKPKIRPSEFEPVDRFYEQFEKANKLTPLERVKNIVSIEDLKNIDIQEKTKTLKNKAKTLRRPRKFEPVDTFLDQVTKANKLSVKDQAKKKISSVSKLHTENLKNLKTNIVSKINKEKTIEKPIESKNIEETIQTVQNIEERVKDISSLVQEKATKTIETQYKSSEKALGKIKESIQNMSTETKVNVGSEIISLLGKTGSIAGTGLRAGYYAKKGEYKKAGISLLYLTPVGSYLTLYQLAKGARELLKSKSEEAKQKITEEEKSSKQATQTLEDTANELKDTAIESAKEGITIEGTLKGFFQKIIDRTSEAKDLIAKGNKTIQEKAKEIDEDTKRLGQFASETLTDLVMSYSTTAKMASGLAEGKLGKFAWGFIGSKLPILYYSVETVKLLGKTMIRAVKYAPEITRAAIKMTSGVISFIGSRIRATIRTAGIITRVGIKSASMIGRGILESVTGVVKHVKSWFDKADSRTIVEKIKDSITDLTKWSFDKFSSLTKWVYNIVGKKTVDAIVKGPVKTIVKETGKTLGTLTSEVGKTFSLVKEEGSKFKQIGKKTVKEPTDLSKTTKEKVTNVTKVTKETVKKAPPTVARSLKTTGAGFKAAATGLGAIVLPGLFGKQKSPEQSALEKIASNTEILAQVQMKAIEEEDKFRKKQESWWDEQLSTLQGMRNRLKGLWKQFKEMRLWNLMKFLFNKTTGALSSIWQGVSGFAGSALGMLGLKKLGKGLIKKIFGNKVVNVAAKEVGKEALEKTATKTVAKEMGKEALEKTATKTVAKELGKEALEKTATKTVTKEVGKEVLEKTAIKEGTKVLEKTGLKTFAKKIPLVGTVAGTAFAIQRLAKGDITGALGEFASGLLSNFGPIGFAASMAVDAALAARDVAKELEQAKKAGKFPEVIKKTLSKKAYEKYGKDILSGKVQVDELIKEKKLIKDKTKLFLPEEVDKGTIKSKAEQAVKSAHIIEQESKELSRSIQSKSEAIPQEVDVRKSFEQERKKEEKDEELKDTLKDLHRGTKEMAQATKESAEKIIKSTVVISNSVSNMVTGQQQTQHGDQVSAKFKEARFYQPKI